MDFQRARHGLSSRPPDGWPLDHLLVGVATIRTLRQLLDRRWIQGREPVRAWDVALWSGCTPQGTRHCMERLRRTGVVRQVVPPRPPRHAAMYELDPYSAYLGPLRHLFEAEAADVGPLRVPRLERNSWSRGNV